MRVLVYLAAVFAGAWDERERAFRGGFGLPEFIFFGVLYVLGFALYIYLKYFDPYYPHHDIVFFRG